MRSQVRSQEKRGVFSTEDVTEPSWNLGVSGASMRESMPSLFLHRALLVERPTSDADVQSGSSDFEINPRRQEFLAFIKSIDFPMTEHTTV